MIHYRAPSRSAMMLTPHWIEEEKPWLNHIAGERIQPSFGLRDSLFISKYYAALP